MKRLCATVLLLCVVAFGPHAGRVQPQQQPTVQQDQGGLASGSGTAEQKQRPVSPEGVEYLKKLLKNTPFGTKSFDLAALRAGMGSRREPTIPGVKLLRVKVDDIPCEWVLAPGADPDLRLLYLHGGGFVSGTGGYYLRLAAHLSAAAKCAVLLPDYRLAPEHPFPAGIDDCVRAHEWLVANGPTGPARCRATFIAGDSAGGSLTLATLLALRDRKKTLPAGGIPLSATTDLTLASESLKTVYDPIISAKTMPVFRDHYLGKTDPKNPLASPVFGDYRGIPPLLIQVGEHEMLRDDSIRVAKKARADGIPVTLEVFPGMFHVFQSHEPLLPEAKESIEHIAAFMRRALAGAGEGATVGRMSTVAGSGRPGHAGDGGPAKEALLNQPFHCDLDGRGHLYIAEAENHCIRKVDLKTGVITTVAGSGKKGYSGDGGPATKATMNEPYALAVDAHDNLYIVDRLNAVIRKVDGKTGVMTTAAGTGKKGYSGDGGKATEALLREPNDCCLDGKGGLLIADVGDWRIRRLDLKTGIITTFAGTGRPEGKPDRGDGGPADKAVVVGGRGVCVDGRGNTYICEREGNTIRKVDARGVITTVAGSAAKGFDDGPAQKTTFKNPKGIRCDSRGDVYIVDTENHAIRKLDVGKGVVTTVAGGHKGAGGDGGDARSAGMDRPHGCILDDRGNLYIADSNNHRVRKVAATMKA